LDETAAREEAAAPLAGNLWPVLLGAEDDIFLAGSFEEEDLAALVGDTAPRVDAADAAEAFMLDTSFLILRAMRSRA
jgi:hypothetical protein